MLGTGLLGAAMVVIYEILVGRMFLDRISDRDDEDEGVAWWNWLGVVAILAGLSVASYYYHHLRNEIEALAIGFVWFLAIGMLLGIVRWFDRIGGHALGIALLSNLARVRAAIDRNGKGASNDGENSGRVVVPFRRR